MPNQEVSTGLNIDLPQLCGLCRVKNLDVRPLNPPAEHATTRSGSGTTVFQSAAKYIIFFGKHLRNRVGPEKSGQDGCGSIPGTIEAASGENSPAGNPDLGISSPVVYDHFPRYFLYLFHQFAQLSAGREIEREGGSREAKS